MVKQVTLNSTTPTLILTPAGTCNYFSIQNNGSQPIRHGIDGVSANISSTKGRRLTAGSEWQVTPATNPQGLRQPIYACLESAGSTTLDIITDDANSS